MRRAMGNGLLAGLAGGAAMAVALLVLGEEPLGRAVALEAARGGPKATALFGRGAQQAGGGLAALFFGAAMGVVFAVAFTALRRRLRTSDDWRAAMALAATALTTLFVVPFLKYPANPPTVGDPDTIARRTVLYLAVISWSVVATWAAWRLWRYLGTRPPLAETARRVPATAVGYLALVVVGLAVLPAAPDPVDAPATLIWQFRLASLAGATAMWAVLGTTFGWLALRPVPASTRPLTPSGR